MKDDFIKEFIMAQALQTNDKNNAFIVSLGRFIIGYAYLWTPNLRAFNVRNICIKLYSRVIKIEGLGGNDESHS